MNIDLILRTFNKHKVGYILIGGVNFLLRHSPVLTYDVDLWIEDDEKNIGRCEEALAALDAQWGSSDKEWRPVAQMRKGWLDRQAVFCLTSPHGSIDIFKNVMGLNDWRSCAKRAAVEKTGAGVPYSGLSDEDMLTSQEALIETERDDERIALLKKVLGKR